MDGKMDARMKEIYANALYKDTYSDSINLKTSFMLCFGKWCILLEEMDPEEERLQEQINKWSKNER